MCWEDQTIARKKYLGRQGKMTNGTLTVTLTPNIYRCGIKIGSTYQPFANVSAEVAGAITTVFDTWYVEIYSGTAAIDGNLITIITPQDTDMVDIEDYGTCIQGPLFIKLTTTIALSWFVTEVLLNFKDEMGK